MRIALCLSGHARTHAEVHKFWKKNLFPYHEVDVFMHLWDTVGPRWFGEGHFEGQGPLPRRDFDSGIIDSPPINIDEIKNLWNPVALVVEDYTKFHDIFKEQIAPVLQERNRRGIPEGFEHHHPLSVRSMLYKRSACNELKINREFMTGKQYDLVIQCRPDVALTKPLDADVLASTSSIFFHNSRSVTKDPEICDFGAIGASNVLDFYCHLYWELDNQLSRVGANFFEFLNPHKMYVRYLNSISQPYVERDIGLCIVRDTGIVLGWPHQAHYVKSFTE